MGYPMTWKRLVNRNHLQDSYDGQPTYDDPLHDARRRIAGDMRRIEADMRDNQFLCMFALHAGITEDQVKLVLDAFFEDRPLWDVPWESLKACMRVRAERTAT